MILHIQDSYDNHKDQISLKYGDGKIRHPIVRDYIDKKWQEYFRGALPYYQRTGRLQRKEFKSKVYTNHKLLLYYCIVKTLKESTAIAIQLQFDCRSSWPICYETGAFYEIIFKEKEIFSNSFDNLLTSKLNNIQPCFLPQWFARNSHQILEPFIFVKNVVPSNRWIDVVLSGPEVRITLPVVTVERKETIINMCNYTLQNYGITV